MSSNAAYMRSRIMYRLKNEFGGVSNITEPKNYHIEFDFKGHHFDINTNNSWWNMDGQSKYQGNQEMFSLMKKL